MSDELLPRFVRIPPGDFLMGANDGDEDERPTHRVFVDGFQLSAYAVTNEQYAEFVRQTGHRVPQVRELPRLVPPALEGTFRDLSASHAWRGAEPAAERARHPVTLVTHADASAFCRWLSEKAGRLVRLPTEAEWERAARGGHEGQRYPWGDDIDPSRANFLPDPALKRSRSTRPVGNYPANAFELYDVVGNVWEWIADWYRSDAHRTPDARAPRGAPASRLRVVRGGSWVTHDVQQLRCATRHKVPGDTYTYSIGFRVAMDGMRARTQPVDNVDAQS